MPKVIDVKVEEGFYENEVRLVPSGDYFTPGELVGHRMIVPGTGFQVFVVHQGNDPKEGDKEAYLDLTESYISAKPGEKLQAVVYEREDGNILVLEVPEGKGNIKPARQRDTGGKPRRR